jgi:sodium/hydrogen exchanger 8
MNNNEISILLMCPWVCYLIAEGLELSGIVAILTNGIFLNYYGTPNISKQSKKVMKIAVDTVAYITEMMVFLFLGIGFFAIDHPYDKLTPGTIILTVVNLNIARALNIGITTFFVNKFRSDDTKINRK